jgi:predicted permease
MIRIVERLYGLLLYGYPPALRRAHAAEMRQCARAALAVRGAAALPRLLADLVVTIPREWLHLSKGISMTGIGRDVAYAIRLFWRSPGFTIAAVLTLALGIGANTAIFSLADATLIRPFRVADPSQLVVLKWTSAYPDYLDYAKRTDLFTGAAGISMTRLNATPEGAPELVDAAFVSGNYFGVMGVPAAAGRVLGEPDDQRNGPLVGVLDYGWWRGRFRGDPGTIGSTIRFNGHAVTIVGVAREGFRGTSLRTTPKVYLPVNAIGRVSGGMMARPGIMENRGFVWLNVIARLREGVPNAAAAAAIDAVYTQNHPSHGSDKEDAMELTPLKRRALGGSADSIFTFVQLLGAVVGITLLIGCANLANLQLARGAARRREIAVRMAIGAGRARIARQLLTESLVLAAAGGGIGLYVATLALQLIARFQLPGGIEIAGLDLGLNRAALFFTALVAGGTGVLFGLAPAWRALAATPSDRFAKRAGRPRRAACARPSSPQIALSLALLVGTGALRSLRTRCCPWAQDARRGDRRRTPRRRRLRRPARPRLLRRGAGARPPAAVTAAAWTTVLPLNGDTIMMTDVQGYRKARTRASSSTWRASAPILQAPASSARPRVRCHRHGHVAAGRHHQRNGGPEVLGRPRPAAGTSWRRRPGGADRRDRRRHEDPAAGRSGRGVRLQAAAAAGRAVRAERLDPRRADVG